MDLNYLLDREQQSLSQSISSPSKSARAAHRAFAKAYGKLLAIGIFPSRSGQGALAQSLGVATADEPGEANSPPAQAGGMRTSSQSSPILTADFITRVDVPLHVRVATPDDENSLIAFFDTVTPEDRRFRFGSATHAVSHDLVAPLLQDDRSIGITFVGFVSDGTLVAASTLADMPGSDDAEVALSVHAGWKGKGIAWALLQHTLAYATAHGLKQVVSFEGGDDRLAINLEREMGFVARLISASPIEVSLTKDVAAE